MGRERKISEVSLWHTFVKIYDRKMREYIAKEIDDVYVTPKELAEEAAISASSAKRYLERWRKMGHARGHEQKYQSRQQAKYGYYSREWHYTPKKNDPPDVVKGPGPWKENPGSSRAAAHFEEFHGYEPDRVREAKLWVPGGLVLLGTAVDTGYDVKDGRSSKSGRYVHDHRCCGVKVYRRAQPGEKASKTYNNWPDEMIKLGRWLGCTYRDSDGEEYEISGKGLRAYAAGSKILALVGTKGVEYVITGGDFEIKDWMYW